MVIILLLILVIESQIAIVKNIGKFKFGSLDMELSYMQMQVRESETMADFNLMVVKIHADCQTVDLCYVISTTKST